MMVVNWHGTAWALLLLAVLIATLGGCDDRGNASRPTPVPSAPPPQPETLAAAPYNQALKQVVGEDCTDAERLEPATPVSYIDGWAAAYGLCSPLFPLTTPDGRRLTAGEWLRARGLLTITCSPEGMRYEFELTGLVGGATYGVDQTTPSSYMPLGETAYASDGAGSLGVTVVTTGRACALPLEDGISVHATYWKPVAGLDESRHAVGHLVFQKP